MGTNEHSIIVLDKFIQATRDSGYKGTASAVSELVDNAVQAGARHIQVLVGRSGDPAMPLEVLVVDDGHGMDPRELRQALRFGGSSRFNNRSGLGRYGMGLPNASFSQARRLDVWTRRDQKRLSHSYLDVDEIVAGELLEVPAPRRRSIPPELDLDLATSGTLIRWTRCDQLDYRRASALVAKLVRVLGQVYRSFIWAGVRIRVNEVVVEPIDPLYVDKRAKVSGATIFEHAIEYEVRATPTSKDIGQVVVRFSELPIDAWHDRDNAEKRRLGISNGAGVSVVRGGREIDFGWFFMGSKRRENYDDWWRCEIRFDPVLDEAFGITHTKQQIRPKAHLRESLEPDLERIAKILNSRVRETHAHLKTARVSAGIEESVTAAFAKLKTVPIPRGAAKESDFGQRIAQKFRLSPTNSNGHNAQPLKYRIVEEKVDEAAFFRPVLSNGHYVAIVNQRHQFYKSFYKQLIEQDLIPASRVREVIQAMLLAAARAEGLATRAGDRQAITRYREAWGESLGACFSGIMKD